jgi:hypothetical protein
MTTVGSSGAQRRRFMPETLSGKSSVVSFGGFLTGATALFLAAAGGQKGGETIFDNLWLGVPGIIALTGAIVSMITGLVALIGRRERYASVLVGTTISAVVVLFIALEFIFE